MSQYFVWEQTFEKNSVRITTRSHSCSLISKLSYCTLFYTGITDSYFQKIWTIFYFWFHKIEWKKTQKLCLPDYICFPLTYSFMLICVLVGVKSAQLYVTLLFTKHLKYSNIYMFRILTNLFVIPVMLLF